MGYFNVDNAEVLWKIPDDEHWKKTCVEESAKRTWPNQNRQGSARTHLAKQHADLRQAIRFIEYAANGILVRNNGQDVFWILMHYDDDYYQHFALL